MNVRIRHHARNFSIAISLLALTAWIVPSYFSAERYRRRLQAELQQELHRPVKFSALSFRLLPRPGFSIYNAEVEEDPQFGSEPFARVDRIECDLRWQSLWRAHMDFARLGLDRPSFNLVLDRRGDWNVEKLLLDSRAGAPEGVGGSSGGRVGRGQLVLEIQDGRVDFKVGADKKPFALTELRARFAIDPAPQRIQFQVKASPVRSNLTIPTPGPVELEGSWTPGRDLNGPLSATLRTRGALLYDWIPILTGRNPEVYGVFDSDLKITGSVPDLTVEGESRLTQLHRWEDLPPSDAMPWTIRFRGRLLRAEDRVVVESLDTAVADSHLHVSGTVEELERSPRLDLVVALERSRVEDVVAAIRRLWPWSAAWSLKGRVDGIITIQGSWKERRYGGFLGAREVSLATASGSFPISDLAVRINNRGARLAPVQVTLTPRVTLVAEGSLDRAVPAPRYNLQLSARNLPMHDALAFGRGFGFRALQGLDATGSASTALHFAGSAWPAERPVLTGRVDFHAVRLLIPGLTEPLNLPRATVQIKGDQIRADPVVAVLGTSVFTARLEHRGTRTNPWQFDVRASTLSLEQAALWFDALGHRQPLPLLQRLPGLASLTARRSAASQLFGSLNAVGRFATPALGYRDVVLKDFQGNFEVTGRTIRMSSAKFRAAGGRGEASGRVDFTPASVHVSASTTMTGISVPVLTARLPGALHSAQGSVDATGRFETYGLGREELGGNLVGTASLHSRHLSFADFDPLDALARQAGWGMLEPARGPIAARSAALTLDVRERRIAVRNTLLELSGAKLNVTGTYALGGALSLNVRADLAHLRRRWLVREGESSVATRGTVRLTGGLGKLTAVPEHPEVSSAGK